MRAELIVHQRYTMDDGAVVEVKVWRLPAPTAERPHGLKYSLFFGRPGSRIVSYDNETGKGDHRHYRGAERPYRFTTFAALFADFWRHVMKEIGDE